MIAETYPCPINIEPKPKTKNRNARIPKSSGESNLSNIAVVNKTTLCITIEDV